MVHDLGRVAIGARIWQKPGPLNADEWEQVRLHPYHTERVLSRSPFLSALAPVAGAHHERLDGSGYHRGAAGAELTLPARVLAAADAYHAMTEPRPHRAAIPPEQAAETLAREAGAGRLDADAVTAVLEAAGQRAPRLERPAGLTEREAEVVGMLARGPADQAGRARARDLGQDRRPPHPERLPQDRRLDPRRGDAVRDGARAGRMGRTPDWCGRRPAPSVLPDRQPRAERPQPEEGRDVTRIGEHAVVLGGSLAGLAAAAVLAQRFERVTIVERDGLPQTGQHRKGVPQGKHVHVLLPAGLQSLAELFPGIREDLRERGAHVFDARALRFNIAGGSLLLEDSDVQSLAATRPLLEGIVARAGAVVEQRPVRRGLRGVRPDDHA